MSIFSSVRPLETNFLLDIVQGFPVPGDSLVKTYFELLLFTEIALQMKNPVNVVAFFPTWVRGALKKGIFLVAEARQEQIPSQLQQKRVKVCVCILTIYALVLMVFVIESFHCNETQHVYSDSCICNN